MTYGFLDIAITPSVQAVQAEMGADKLWENFQGDRRFDRFTENEIAFISARDSFYMASVSEAGWPYLQHRGGPPGFLKVLNDTTLAFADYRGNRQYISTGNIAANGRVCLFLVDYPRRARLKIYARAERLPLDAEPALTVQVSDPAYKARLERVFRFRLEAFDWNCPQHITPRFTEQEIATAFHPIRDRLTHLESENKELRAQLAAQGET